MEIREFQDSIRQIYLTRDAKRGPDRTFLWFLEEVGELTRSYRRAEKENIGQEMADVMAWLASMANLLGVDLEAGALKKVSPHLFPLPLQPLLCPFA